MALVPPFYFDCVVAIGQQLPDGNKNWIGTGFLYGKFIEQREGSQKSYKTYLVSNKHVFQDQNLVLLRFNPSDDQPAKDYPTRLVNNDGMQLWTGHSNPEVDIAVIGINTKHLQAEGMKFHFFRSDEMVFTKAKLQEIETTEGDYVYVLGFPMGLVALDRQHVILRSGAIARIRDLFEGRSTDFIVDALVFPGNSGGPVVLKPEMVSIQGTRSNLEAGLIGVIKSYIPYQDIAVSQQTGRPRIIFEDNSGLSLVEPTDYIIETIDEDERLKPQPPTTTEQ
jgi:S1-C subfamily serine protease